MATSGSAQTEKELDCGYQADVAGAVQQARLDGVSERKVESAIEETNPSWPARYSNAHTGVCLRRSMRSKNATCARLELRSEWLATCMNN